MKQFVRVTVDIRLTTTQAIQIRILLLSNTTRPANLPSPFARLALSLFADLLSTSRRRKTVADIVSCIYIYICTLSRRSFYCVSFPRADLESHRNRFFAIELSRRQATVLRLLIVARLRLRVYRYLQFRATCAIRRHANREHENRKGKKGE